MLHPTLWSETYGGSNALLRVGTHFSPLLKDHFCHLVVVHRARKESTLNRYLLQQKELLSHSLIATFRVAVHRVYAPRDFHVCYVKKFVHFW